MIFLGDLQDGFFPPCFQWRASSPAITYNVEQTANLCKKILLSRLYLIGHKTGFALAQNVTNEGLSLLVKEYDFISKSDFFVAGSQVFTKTVLTTLTCLA